MAHLPYVGSCKITIMNEDIQKSGANARALGCSEFDNPYFKPDAVPGNTGEPLEEWLKKAEAWMLGWKIEDAMRK